MAKVNASIVHDELGRILSVTRPSKDAKVIVLGGAGQSVLITEIDEETAAGLVNTHRVDISRNSLIER